MRLRLGAPVPSLLRRALRARSDFSCGAVNGLPPTEGSRHGIVPVHRLAISMHNPPHWSGIVRQQCIEPLGLAVRRAGWASPGRCCRNR